LEAVVYSHRAAAQVQHEMAKADTEPVPAMFAEPAFSKADAAVDAEGIRERLRQVMWEEVGIVRDRAGLERAAGVVAELRDLATAALAAGPADPASIELRNLCVTATLIIECAQQRRESRGLHHDLDHPYRDNEHFLRDTVLTGGER
jgi:L-aspartate oxidase